MRASEDGELLPPVVVDIPDVLYLQVVDTDDCEDWPAPSDPGERTHCDERINASDVAYVPLERAESAEGERDRLRAELDAARAGWRPVTEAPLNVPVYVYVGYSDPFVARRIGENLWQDLDGAEFRFTDHGRFLYRPLPPAPGGEEARP